MDVLEKLRQSKKILDRKGIVFRPEKFLGENRLGDEKKLAFSKNVRINTINTS